MYILYLELFSRIKKPTCANDVFLFHPLVKSPLAAVKQFIFRVGAELVFIPHTSVSNGQQPRGKSSRCSMGHTTTAKTVAECANVKAVGSTVLSDTAHLHRFIAYS